MKKIVFILVVTGISLLMFCCAIKRVEKRQGLTTTPEKVDLFVNQSTDPYTVKVNYTLNVPANYLPSCGRLVYKPYFIAEDHQYDLTPVIISGRQYQREEKRLEQLSGVQPDYPDAINLIYTGEGMKIKLSQVVPFELWMVKSKLRAAVMVEACDRGRDLYDLLLADGMFYMPTGPGPVRVEYVKEMAEVQKTREFSFIFPVGHYNLNAGYDGNGKQMMQMEQLLDSLRDNKQMQLQKIVVTGSSSPFGALAFNKKLAEWRAAQLKQTMTKFPAVNSDKIELVYVSENWKGLQQAVQQSDMKEKKSIISILEDNISDGQRKQLLRKQPQYEYLRLHVFPELQSATCKFIYSQKEEITKVIPE